MKDYTPKERREILEEILHNYGGIFDWLDNERPESHVRWEANHENMESLRLLLKGPKFFEFFINNCPEEYSHNHIGEQAHWLSELGAAIEETGFKFKRDRPI